MVDILMSETCWAYKKWNKIASDINLVFYSSTIKMMHGPINIRFKIAGSITMGGKTPCKASLCHLLKYYLDIISYDFFVISSFCFFTKIYTNWLPDKSPHWYCVQLYVTVMASYMFYNSFVIK